jgi:hypothetical protein
LCVTNYQTEYVDEEYEPLDHLSGYWDEEMLPLRGD